MSYLAPVGYRVGLNYTRPYTIPPGYRVGLEFGSGGTPGGEKQYLFPGRASSGVQFGAPSTFNRTQVVSNAGALPPANGYGTHSVWLYTRYLLPPGAHTQSFGTQWASHYLRYITAAGVGDKTERGTPWISRSPRELAPAGFDAMKVLESHVVGGTRHIFPVGTEMTQWGTRIIPEGQVAYPAGFAGEVGKPDVQLYTRYLHSQSFRTNPDDLRFGRQDVWNLRQIVQQDYDHNDGLNPPPFGQWTAIENRNKAPVPVGWLSERIGYQFIWNKASPMAPPGIEPPADAPTYKAGSVTHWRRELQPGGIDSLASERWHALFNTADVLAPPGADHLPQVGFQGHDLVVVGAWRCHHHRGVVPVEAAAVADIGIDHRLRGIDGDPFVDADEPRRQHTIGTGTGDRRLDRRQVAFREPGNQ